MQPMDVSPDELMAAAQRIADAATELGGGLTDLETTVTTANPWGGDEPGTVFGMAYVATVSHALETMGSHLDLMVTAVENLASWAESVQLADQQAAEGLYSVGQRMSG